MPKLTLKQSDVGHWQLTGELSFTSLSQEMKSLALHRPQAGEWRINLSGLSRVDSAGIAYLLDCVRYAQSKKITLKLEGFSAAAQSLAKVQGVSALLNPFIG